MNRVISLGRDERDEIIDVMCDAFFDYPVMRYTLGLNGDYGTRLRQLVGLFVAGRVHRDDPLMGIRGPAGELRAAVTLSQPTSRDPDPEFMELRVRTWGELGDDARQRYEQFTVAARNAVLPDEHLHVNMIGVRRDFQGSGLARAMLERVHELSSSMPRSGGVSLTTERTDNVRFYERFGYRVVGHANVAPDFETWTMFRAKV